MTVASLGTFDIPSYGDLLQPLLLQRRLESIRQELLVVSPVGGQVFPDALPSLGLDDFLHTELPLRGVVLGGGDLLQAHAGATPYSGMSPSRSAAYASLWLGAEAGALRHGAPLAWNAAGAPRPLAPVAAGLLRRVAARSQYISVRDDGSEALLRMAGCRVRAPVVPDPAFEAAGLFDRRELEETFRVLVSMKGRRAEGRFVTLHATPASCSESPAELAEVFDAIARRLHATPVLLSVSRCEGDAALMRDTSGFMASRPLVFDTPYRLQEIAACLAHSVAYFGPSIPAALTAFGHRVPFVFVDSRADHEREGVLELLERGQDHAPTWRALVVRLDDGGLTDVSRDARVASGIQARLDDHWRELLAVLQGTPRRRRSDRPVDEHTVVPQALLLEMLEGAVAPGGLAQQHHAASTTREGAASPRAGYRRAPDVPRPPPMPAPGGARPLRSSLPLGPGTVDGDWGALDRRDDVATRRSVRREGVVGRPWLKAWQAEPPLEHS